MVQWVWEALEEAPSVGWLVVVGLSSDTGLSFKGKPLWTIPSQGTSIHNAAAGAKALMQRDPNCQRTLWVAADLPLIRPDMVEWFAAEAEKTEHQLLAGVVETSTLATAFLGAGRTSVRLDGQRVCPCDIYAGDTALADGMDPIWFEITRARKRHHGAGSSGVFLPLVLLLLGRLTEAGIARSVERRLACTSHHDPRKGSGEEI